MLSYDSLLIHNLHMPCKHVSVNLENDHIMLNTFDNDEIYISNDMSDIYQWYFMTFYQNNII